MIGLLMISVLVILLSYIIIVAYGAGVRGRRIQIETRRSIDLPKHIRKVGKPSSHDQHNVIFAIKQRNISYLRDLLMNVSMPGHPQYGKYLSRVQVGELTSNTESTDFVLSYLSHHDVEVQASTLYGEYISVKGSVTVLESIFQTKFYKYQNVRDQSISLRADRYSVDEVLKDHISAVFNVIQLPVEFHHSSIISDRFNLLEDDGAVMISDLNSQYNIDSNVGDSRVSQAIFSSLDNYFSPNDIFKFQQSNDIPMQNVSFVVNGQASDEKCFENINYCAEANLDLQYIMGLSQVTPTTFWYERLSENTFVSWIFNVASIPNPPLVNSLSYGSFESQLDVSIESSFNDEAIKLGVQGVTILASTGDDGVANYFARDDPSNCGYNPSFPSTSHFVTAVGATQGRSTLPEISSSILTGGIITSGGGFSDLFPTPGYQIDAVRNYFDNLSSCPESGYNCNGRGYPDVSFAGLNFLVVIAGDGYLASGTSASTPAFAALVSLVNAVRAQAGKPSLGFLNNAIYMFGPDFTNDITSSNNRCTADICCSQGFECAQGWDPVTGWGSVDFAKFRDIFIDL